jgi:hypothetical protein
MHQATLKDKASQARALRAADFHQRREAERPAADSHFEMNRHSKRKPRKWKRMTKC